MVVDPSSLRVYTGTNVHANADALSRLHLPDRIQETLVPAELILLTMEQLQDTPPNTDEQIWIWAVQDLL